ncbi:PQQ-dependent sugar dehydrogenase [Patescibacteria group bacterium]|nr:PQQ-dependent sugar dehydrogenase [Patescibacteria group bacterium]
MKTRRILAGVLLVLATAVVLLFFLKRTTGDPGSSINSDKETAPIATEEITVLIRNLEIPWQTVFLPNGDLLVTERPGRLVMIKPDLATASIEVSGVRHVGEGGLLGAVLHPDYNENNHLYLYFTTDGADGLENRIYRYVLDDVGLHDQELVLANIRGASNHNGGRIAFGPDGYLYATTGDAQDANLAQDTSSLNGKILRITAEGNIPPDNPFNNAVYSYGHRNPQGLAWDESGHLWATEHGPSGLASGWDELNLIQKGGNYGWPLVKGDEESTGMINPEIHSGASDTWAPSGAAYYQGRVFFAGLRGAVLYEYRPADQSLIKHFENTYGRIRDVTVGPDNFLYLLTSNRDGRGTPSANDDLLIKIDPDLFAQELEVSEPPVQAYLPDMSHAFQTFNNCGPAALSMALSYFDISVSQAELGAQLRPYQNPQGNNDDKSVTLAELGEKAKDYGFVTYLRPAGSISLLESFLANDMPVITKTWLTTTESIGHFRVIRGYNRPQKYIIQNDSYQGKDIKYSYAEFNELWKKFNYEYLVLVPTQKNELAEALLGKHLSETNAWEDAVLISRDQLEDNFQDIYARFNLSVAYYELGEYEQAIKEYEKVEQLLPFRTLWYQTEPILAYYEVGNYQRVFQLTDRVLNGGNRAFSELYELRAEIYRQQDNDAAAERELALAKKYRSPMI